MPSQNQRDIESKEVDPWWAKYWYVSTIAICIWLLVAIYGAVKFDLELADARVVVREHADGRALGDPICQIELWWVVVVVPLSLIVVNAMLAFFSRIDQSG